VTYKLVNSDKLKEEEKKVKALAARVREAFINAIKKWNEENEEPFPLRTYVIPSMKKMDTYINQKSAEAMMKKLKEKVEKERIFRANAEKMNLAKMSPKKREAYLQKKRDVEKGFQLLARQLNPQKDEAADGKKNNKEKNAAKKKPVEKEEKNKPAPEKEKAEQKNPEAENKPEKEEKEGENNPETGDAAQPEEGQNVSTDSF
jgi:hypothetical protein